MLYDECRWVFTEGDWCAADWNCSAMSLLLLLHIFLPSDVGGHTDGRVQQGSAATCVLLLCSTRVCLAGSTSVPGRGQEVPHIKTILQTNDETISASQNRGPE